MLEKLENIYNKRYNIYKTCRLWPLQPPVARQPSLRHWYLGGPLHTHTYAHNLRRNNRCHKSKWSMVDIQHSIVSPNDDDYETLQIQGSSVSFVLVVVYRPESEVATSVFFDVFANFVERSAVYVAPIVLVGDINLHLDGRSAPSTTSYRDILDRADLVQHVVCPSHRVGHTPDVTRRTTSGTVLVDPPPISDHLLVTIGAPLRCLNRAVRETDDRFQTFVNGTGRRRLQERLPVIDVNR